MNNLLKNLELLARARDYQIGQRVSGEYYVMSENNKILAEISEDRLGVKYYVTNGGEEYVEIDIEELEDLKQFVTLLRSE